MKRLGRIAALMAVLLGITCGVSWAATDQSGLDVAIVVDTSGSMNQTDPDRISIDAAKLFVDMMEIEGSRAALVPFSDELGLVVELTSVETADEKALFNDGIGQLRNGGDTDIGLAVQEGYRLLTSVEDQGNKQAILFFTDGNIDLGDGRIRTNEDSLNDVKAAIAAASDAQIPIYTIGLNANGNVDKTLLGDMASQTGGRSYVVESAEDLPDIFNGIFADFIDSNIIPGPEITTDGVNFSEVTLSIPNDSVQEANVIMLTTKALTEIEVLAPDGTVQEMDRQNLILSQSSQYSLLKIVRPTAGDWLLRIKSDEVCKVHFNFIFNYKVDLVTEAEIGLLEDGTKGIIGSGYFEKKGSVLTDETMYSQFSGVMTVTDENGNKKEYPLTQNGNKFEGRAPLDSYGVYQVAMRVDSASMYRESEPVEVSLFNSPPEQTSDLPEVIELKGLFANMVSSELSLSDYFEDPEGEELTFTAVMQDGSAEADLDAQGVVTLKPAENGEDLLMITAADPDGLSVSAEIPVTVKYTFRSFLPLILILLAVIVVIVILVTVIRRNKERNTPWYGKIRWMVVKGGGFGSFGVNREQVYDMGYERGPVLLSRIVTDGTVSGLELNKVVLTMNGKTNSSMFIRNNSKKCRMTTGFGGSQTVSAELKSGEFVMLAGGENGELSVKITYSLNAF